MVLPMVEQIRIADFDYPLPEARIASHPLRQRDACRLLVSGPDGTVKHRLFSDIPALLEPEALLVRNNTRVINARMRFRKPTGSTIEVFLLEPFAPADYAESLQAEGACSWSCLVGNLKRWKEGTLCKQVQAASGSVTLTAGRGRELPGGEREILFSWTPKSVAFADVVEAAGYIPIPPYLRRDTEKSDSTDYQTVYSRIEGSVAAPTAGLHFTDALFDQLRAKGIETAEVTLHVGAGTFRPVKSDIIGDHPMHTETFSVSASLLRSLIAALEQNRPVVAVGTTSVRTLESLPYLGAEVLAGKEPEHVGQWSPYKRDADFDTLTSLRALLAYMERHELDSLHASTAIMIAPGFRWRIVGRLITNFHQPKSTLLLLVGSFLEPEAAGELTRWRRIYNEALAADYRFLSYGDACLFSPLK